MGQTPASSPIFIQESVTEGSVKLNSSDRETTKAAVPSGIRGLEVGALRLVKPAANLEADPKDGAWLSPMPGWGSQRTMRDGRRHAA